MVLLDPCNNYEDNFCYVTHLPNATSRISHHTSRRQRLRRSGPPSSDDMHTWWKRRNKDLKSRKRQVLLGSSNNDQGAVEEEGERKGAATRRREGAEEENRNRRQYRSSRKIQYPSSTWTAAIEKKNLTPTYTEAATKGSVTRATHPSNSSFYFIFNNKTKGENIYIYIHCNWLLPLADFNDRNNQLH